MQEAKEEAHDGHHLRREGVDGGGKSVQSTLSVFMSGTADEVFILAGWEERYAQFSKVSFESAGYGRHVQLAMTEACYRITT